MLHLSCGFVLQRDVIPGVNRFSTDSARRDVRHVSSLHSSQSTGVSRLVLEVPLCYSRKAMIGSTRSALRPGTRTATIETTAMSADTAA